MKKSLQDVELNLAALAAQLPTQNVKPRVVEAVPTVVSVAQKPKPEVPTKKEHALAEPEVQFNFGMPRSVRKALALKALEADMTMRGYILAALRDKGIEVDEAVIVDARRKEG